MRIFISYRRADSTFLIGRIKDRLTTAFGDQSVFRDLDDIPAGVDFRTVLEKETNGCNVMLVIIGPQWEGVTDIRGNKRLFNPRDHTRIEIETGISRLSKGNILLIPVLVMDAVMPAPQDLPESLLPLTYQNAISIRNDPDFNNDIERLIRDIRHSHSYREKDISTVYFEPQTIYVSEGPFRMGSPSGQNISIYESPQHEVVLPAYRIGKYPITNGQYEEFISQTKILVSPTSGWDGQQVPPNLENHPVIGVTWYAALAYCRWLSEKTGHSYSLPNEAQWEKACRGGMTSIYPWGDEFDSERCNFGRASVASVNAYPAQNAFGIFDLVGNVYQWTCTLWGEKFIMPDRRYGYPWNDDQRNNINASRQVRRVVRGSSMQGDKSLLRCGARARQLPDAASLSETHIGFRVIMNV